MNILFIDREISMAGSCVVTANAARELANKGHNVKFAGMFTEKGYPDLGNAEIVAPNKMIQKLIKKNKFLLTFSGPLFLLLEVFKNSLWSDVIIPGSYPTQWIAVIAGKIFRKKIIWNCFEPWIDFDVKEIKQIGLLTWTASKIAGNKLLNTIFIPFIDAIFVLDLKNKKKVLKHYNRKATVIYPGVDFNFFSKGEKIKAVKRWKFEKGFNAICTASLTPMKNQIILVKSLPKLINKIPDFHFIFAGNGPLENYLKIELIKIGLKDRVHFLGQVSPDRLRDLYAFSDILVFPAVRQTWGLTPFEAACVGTPSIVSSDCGASEILHKENIGLVCKATSGEFTKSIIKIYQDNQMAKRLGIQAKLFVEENMTWAKYAENILELVMKTKAL